ncbi:anti-sigma factor [Pseudokineococcus lusitanus]|uniref:Anti-sigma-K factor rskA n=1 Tax=Pseudokineococcus lusitanus TaxID=763993 RepID=A0A3N1GA06_9ACTN|nr:anti-sigma factor [Pseudokineococcus lusitanus]ROP27072.1 anti-sigma-K factor rskA [Pseudokineococcus lusitanus]
MSEQDDAGRTPGAHATDDELAGLALGEPADARLEQHLAGCARCRAVLVADRRAVDAGRAGEPADLLRRPPDRVLDAVLAEVARDRPVPAPGPAPAVPVQRRVRRPVGRALATAGAAVALLAVGVLAGLGLGGLGGTGGGAVGDVLATAELRTLADDAPGGTAVLREVDGVPVVDVDLGDRADDPADGAGPGAYEEVWLLDPDGGLVSLGVLAGGRGTFTAPPAALDVDGVQVDVSREPLDGSPAHSGDSLVRGALLR